MKLTGSELKALSLIARHDKVSVSDLVSELSELPAQVSRLTSALQEKDFVKVEKIGLSKILSLSEAKHADLWRKLVLEFEHIPFDELLSGVSLEVLSAICFLSLRSRKEIAKRGLVSEPSVARTLEKLRQVGMVEKSDSGYRISPRFQTLKEFVMECRRHLNQKLARKFAADAVVRWESNNEFIVESKKTEEEDAFRLTASSVFPSFGIGILSSTSYFFYPSVMRKVRLEDAILHSLLVQSQNLLPLLLVWKKNIRRIDMRYLTRAGEIYGAGQRVGEVAAYLESEGRESARGLPPWDEFVVRTREYGLQ